MNIPLKENERLDDLQNGYHIIQNTRDFCYGIDAVLLSDFARVKKGEQALDLGTGTGIIPILLKAKTQGEHFTGLEIQEQSAEMAGRSVVYNHLEDAITIRTGDIKEAAAIFGRASFSVVTCNPPYMHGNHGLTNPHLPKAIARHEVLCTLEDVISQTAQLLKPRGRFYMVHRPFRLAEIMGLMMQYKLEPKRMRLVYSRVDKELGALEEKFNEAIGNKALLENRENILKKQSNDCALALAQIGVVDTDAFESQHTDLLNVALVGLDKMRDTLQSDINSALRKQRETKGSKSGDLKNLIYRFKNPTEEITAKYRDWRSDVNRLPEAVEFVGEYQTYYQRLLDEDLPGFESRFNKYLQENIINKVSAFNMFFQNWRQSITKTIDQLNSYLVGIDFKDAPKTYIQLVAAKRLNVDLKEFQDLLSSAIPNIHEMNSTIDGSRIHFEQHIEPLMSRLQDESWRKLVMDVRGWYTYKSEEFYQDDGQKRNTYEAMGQLSGGEKAQLTYTILGSAIAYQFGLTKSGLDSSFRFIAIDEAFRAQDEDKARYLISLCKQLHLQLLVVTPSDNIHIVENDISYVHYVERKGNCSVLYNMPISEFKAERERSMEV